MVKTFLPFACVAILVGTHVPLKAAPQSEGGTDLRLICEGEKVASVTTGTTTAGVVSSNGGSAVGSAVTTQPTKVSMTIQLRLSGELGEINVNAKWSKIKDLVVNEDEISGAIGSTWLGTRQHFRIDRGTGRITTDGTFHGECRKLLNEPKKF